MFLLCSLLVYQHVNIIYSVSRSQFHLSELAAAKGSLYAIPGDAARSF